MPYARQLVPALVLATLVSLEAGAQQLEPIRYVVRIPAPRTHYLEVEATYPTGGRPSVELMLAVWTPGSYLVREFARNVEGVTARGAPGAALGVQKTRKNRWLVQTGGADHVVLSYRVYGHERAGRLNWIEGEFGLINGAPTFITLAERVHRPHEVTLELPAGWARSITAMPAAAGRDHYRAADYDMLVDSPIVAGNPTVYDFTIDGIPHSLVNVAVGPADSVWNGPRSAADIEHIVRTARAFWGALPYDRYIFFNFLFDSYDGIEHKGSTVLFADRWSTRTESGYHEWLDLAAHEFDHAWNVKRLRPVELGPFDYENENYTRSLWIAEGINDYISWLLVRRSGLGTTAQALGDVSAAIGSLQATPGRLVQPVELASFDAWIKQYRPDENSVNTSISYYTKGSVVGLLLDARIRRITGGARSLDDVMRAAYARYSGERGYTPAEFRAVANEIAGADLTAFFHRTLETTEELDYSELLDWYGLRFAAPDTSARGRAWLGIRTRVLDGRLLVSRIERGTPAYGSGLDVDDEIVAVDDYRIGADGLDPILPRFRPGSRVTITVAARQNAVRTVSVVLSGTPAQSWMLEARPDATPQQKAHLEAWLAAR